MPSLSRFSRDIPECESRCESYDIVEVQYSDLTLEAARKETSNYSRHILHVHISYNYISTFRRGVHAFI